MNSERWKVLKALFEATVDLDATSRMHYLEEMCAGDSTLLAEIVRLLAQHNAAGEFLSPRVTETASPSFATGELVSNRYRVVRQLGCGGMGEVYEAVDLHLGESLALKTVRADIRGSDAAFDRLAQELQLARKVTHTNVCRVFDIGRHHSGTAEIIFLTMELLDGETLAARLKRQSTIPPAETLHIGRSIAAGVTAAHESGVIHRDLKPANIFLASSGRIVVTDFGIARGLAQSSILAETGEADLLGTPPYMAPELLSGGQATASSDTYAIGVILYEMITGRRPYDDTGDHGELLPSAWKPIVERTLHADPLQRFQTPAEVIRALDRADGPAAHSRRLKIYLLSLVAGVALLAMFLRISESMGWIGTSTSSGDSTFSRSKTPALFLGDVENFSGNPAYDFTVSQLLSTAVEQSRFLNVLSRSRVSEALGRAGRPPAERLTRELASELARREGADYALSGEISKTAKAVEIALTLTPIAANHSAKTIRASLAGPEQLPAVIGQMAAEVRAWLGESPSQISVTNIPLEQATTRSAIAWERYSRAVRMQALGRFEDEVSLLQSAVDIDPEFASAYVLLGVQQNVVGNMEAGLRNVTQAYALRSRTTEREAYTIAGLYHSLRYEFEKATDAFRTVTNLYPFDDVAHRYFAQSLSNQLLVRESITAGRRAAELNPKSLINVTTLAGNLIQAGEYDEALLVLDGIRTTGGPAWNQFAGQALLGLGDFQKARDAFEPMTAAGASWENAGRQHLAITQIMEGRFMESAAQLEADLSLSPRGRDTRLLFKRHNWLAWIYALANKPDLARAHVLALVHEQASPANLRELRSAAIAMARHGEFTLVGTIAKSIEEFSHLYESNNFPAALAHIRAAEAHKRGDYAKATSDYEEAMKLWPDVLTLWSAAEFFEEIGQLPRAKGLYNEVIARKGEIIILYFPGFVGLAQLGRARTEMKLLDYESAIKDYDSVLQTFGRFSPEFEFVRRAAVERDRAVHLLNSAASRQKG